MRWQVTPLSASSAGFEALLVLSRLQMREAGSSKNQCAISNAPRVNMCSVFRVYAQQSRRAVALDKGTPIRNHGAKPSLGNTHASCFSRKQFHTQHQHLSHAHLLLVLLSLARQPAPALRQRRGPPSQRHRRRHPGAFAALGDGRSSSPEKRGTLVVKRRNGLLQSTQNFTIAIPRSCRIAYCECVLAGRRRR